MVSDGLYGKNIAVGSESADLAQADTGRERPVAEVLAGVDVREVDLHLRDGYHVEGVADHHRGVGESAEIADQSLLLRLVHQFVQLLDQLALMVALEETEHHVGERLFEHGVDIVERERAVVVGITLAEHVQVGSIDDEETHFED